MTAAAGNSEAAAWPLHRSEVSCCVSWYAVPSMSLLLPAHAAATPVLLAGSAIVPASKQQRVLQAPHLVQVRLHQLKHHVDVLEVPRAGWQHDVLDLHDVCNYSKMQGRHSST